MYKQLIPLFSSKGVNAKLTILIYHRVLEKADPYREEEVSTEEFDWHMRLIAKYFQVMGLSDAISKLKEGCLPARAICVTFDDGYADNFHAALPILNKWSVPATFFISTSYLDGGCMWNDIVIDSVSHTHKQILNLTGHNLGSYPISTMDERKSTIRELLKKLKHLPYDTRLSITQAINENLAVEIDTNIMMTAEQVSKLVENNMEIGAHTNTHPILTKVENNIALDEIEKSKNVLEKMLNTRIGLFAYPNGKPRQDYNEHHVSMVRELGFDAAVSTEWGVSNRHSDLYQLPRFTPWDQTPNKFMIRLLRNYFS